MWLRSDQRPPDPRHRALAREYAANARTGVDARMRGHRGPTSIAGDLKRPELSAARALPGLITAGADASLRLNTAARFARTTLREQTRLARLAAQEARNDRPADQVRCPGASIVRWHTFGAANQPSHTQPREAAMLPPPQQVQDRAARA